MSLVSGNILDMVEEKKPEELKEVKKRVISRKQKRGFVLVALLLLGFSVVFISGSKKDESTSIKEDEIITYSTDSPSEDKPGSDYVWKGKPQNPKKISIPSVDIENFIQAVGVDQNKEVAVPNNIHLAGWFADSVIPGQKGLSIIDGHVDGRTQEGVFKRLPNVQKESEVIVTFGDDTTKKFRVISITEVSESEAASVLFSQYPKVSNQLNLITCVGQFNQSTKRYDKRVIVAAELVE